MLLGKNREIAPERMKRLSQSRNDDHVWMCLVVKAKSNAVEQYCIGTWNVKSMNQSKLEVVKQRMARVNVDIKGYFSTYMKIGCRRDSLPVRVDKGKGGLLPGYLF